MNKIKVLVIDDSAVTRNLLKNTLSKSRDIEVVGSAIDPIIAVNKIKRLNPDILTLDIEMPRMDGLTFLSKLMVSRPMPVIMVSSLTENGAKETIKALELGAVDFVLKPKLDDEECWNSFSDELIEKVIAASGAKIKRRIGKTLDGDVDGIKIEEKYSADAVISKKRSIERMQRSDSIIAIGASTGGTEVIAEIITNLQDDVPGIVIAQHMPEKFTLAFANRINGVSKLYVKEAEHGDRVYKGVALIAPGNRHMILKSDVQGYWVEINDGLPVNRHKPSVDVLFRSVANIASRYSLGILLTGMGADGAQGLLEIRDAGIKTIAQDEASCVVFGMPAEAIRLGAADMVMNVDGITRHISELAVA